MKTNSYLLPYYFKKIGFGLLSVTLAYFVYTEVLEKTLLSVKIWCYSGFGENKWGMVRVNLDNTIVIVGLILSLIFVAQSKEKIEDEYISHIRARAFALTLWISSLSLIIATLLVFDLAYLSVMLYNLFAFLVIYIIIKQLLISRFRRANNHEE